MQMKQFELFTCGEKNYHTFRIPALEVTIHGTLLAFAEGRKYGPGDTGEIDILLKRSFDNGETWEPIQRVASQRGMTCGNPCPVVDHSTGTIWLPFCKNAADANEKLITEGKAERTVWMTRSTDGGLTWAIPTEITKQVKDPSWTWYATGPGHGIQLKSGRLLVPCDHMVGVHHDRTQDPYHSHVIYSDDQGESWQIGGIVGDGTNECAVAELNDGTVYINCRNYVDGKRRAVAWSHDQGESFSPVRWDETLIEPICQASLVRATNSREHDRNRVIFANPASTEREKLTIRVSYDECRSWPVSKVLNPGPSAYSDLAVTPDGAIHCLYECGKESPYEMLCHARFNVDWIR